MTFYKCHKLTNKCKQCFKLDRTLSFSNEEITFPFAIGYVLLATHQKEYLNILVVG